MANIDRIYLLVIERWQERGGSAHDAPPLIIYIYIHTRCGTWVTGNTIDARKGESGLGTGTMGTNLSQQGAVYRMQG